MRDTAQPIQPATTESNPMNTAIATKTEATLSTMRQKDVAIHNLPSVQVGLTSLQGFELVQRAAKLLASSTLVPAAYRATSEKKDRFGNVTAVTVNESAIPNCVVALNMAQRMGADALMVMQNLYIVEGRPSWSSQWIIAAINGCGRFSPLRFDIKDAGEKTVERIETFWENNQKQTRNISVKIKDKVCIAWAVEKETGTRIESPAVSIEMAVKEGWYTKNGSKWQTMEEVMLRYRTASFFGKLYAPELLMGLQSVEEVQDFVMIDTERREDGSYATTSENLRRPESPETAPVVDVDPLPPHDPVTGEIFDDATPAQPEAEPEEDANPADMATPLSDMPELTQAHLKAKAKAFIARVQAGGDKMALVQSFNYEGFLKRLADKGMASVRKSVLGA